MPDEPLIVTPEILVIWIRPGTAALRWLDGRAVVVTQDLWRLRL